MSNLIDFQAARRRIQQAKHDFEDDYIQMLEMVYQDSHEEFEMHALVETFEDGTFRVIDYVGYSDLDGSFADVTQKRKEIESYLGHQIRGKLSVRTFTFPVPKV
jgi:hypothetical protein